MLAAQGFLAKGTLRIQFHSLGLAGTGLAGIFNFTVDNDEPDVEYYEL